MIGESWTDWDEWKMDDARLRAKENTVNIDELIRQLHEARQAEADAKETVGKLRFELEANPLYGRYQRWKDLQKQARGEARAIESQVKDALLEPTLNGDRHPAVHAVRSRLRFRYEHGAALSWALENLWEAVTLNEKAFEDYCKEAKDSKYLDLPDFVEAHETHSLSLKRDLSEWASETPGEAENVSEDD